MLRPAAVRRITLRADRHGDIDIDESLLLDGMGAAPVAGITVETERRMVVTDDFVAVPLFGGHQMAVELGERQLAASHHTDTVGRIVETAQRTAVEGVRCFDVSAGIVGRGVLGPHRVADGDLDDNLDRRTRQRHRHLDQIARTVVELRVGRTLHEQRRHRRLGAVDQLRGHGNHLGECRTARPRSLVGRERLVAVLAVAVVGHHADLVLLPHDKVGRHGLAQRYRSRILGDGKPLVVETLLAVVDEDIGRFDPALDIGAEPLIGSLGRTVGRELQVDAPVGRTHLRLRLLRRAGGKRQRARNREYCRISIYPYHKDSLYFTVPSGQSCIHAGPHCRRAGRD